MPKCKKNRMAGGVREKQGKKELLAATAAHRVDAALPLSRYEADVFIRNKNRKEK